MAVRDIFPYKSFKDEILFLDKKEWQIYYSTKYKYPYIVIEKLGLNTGKTEDGEKIIRTEITDPFGPDPEIPKKYSLTKLDYKKYMMYGGSPGHNAPAGNHKTNMEIFSDTFKYSNMTPQEIVLNSGIWVVLESWCRFICKNIHLKNFIVITGSIPDTEDKKFNNKRINVPSYMYKLLMCRPRFPRYYQKNNLYYACFVYKNTAINPNPDTTNIRNFMVQLNDFLLLSKINLYPIIEKYYKDENFKNLQLIHIDNIKRINFIPNAYLQLQMERATMYGLLIYSTTLEQLELNWKKCLTLEEKFGNLEFHKEYYDLAKKRIKKMAKSLTK